MSVRVAASAGFCFGVDRAVGLVEQTVREGKRAVTLGPIIHNHHVVQHFAALGVQGNVPQQRRTVADGEILRFTTAHTVASPLWRRTSSQMTTGAPKTAVTELMDSSVGANRLRAMRSQSRQNAAPPRQQPGRT